MRNLWLKSQQFDSPNEGLAEEELNKTNYDFSGRIPRSLTRPSLKNIMGCMISISLTEEEIK